MTDPNTPPSTTPPAYEAPAYPNAPAYEPQAAAGAPVPGKTLGIVGLVLAIVPGTQLIGFILGIVALVQSRKAGLKNGMAVAAIIVSSVLFVISVIVTIAIIAYFASLGGDLFTQVEACLDDPTGTVVFQGVTMTCEEVLSSSGY